MALSSCARAWSVCPCLRALSAAAMRSSTFSCNASLSVTPALPVIEPQPANAEIAAALASTTSNLWPARGHTSKMAASRNARLLPFECNRTLPDDSNCGTHFMSSRLPLRRIRAEFGGRAFPHWRVIYRLLHSVACAVPSCGGTMPKNPSQLPTLRAAMGAACPANTHEHRDTRTLCSGPSSIVSGWVPAAAPDILRIGAISRRCGELGQHNGSRHAERHDGLAGFGG